ncbi:hypothetical protein AA12717_0245 [Gluconacetobacter sacchari DSM 12717]|uniref:Uncharacterized protein n=2 Tax=Gluconacetobacter sacchari TaxID=92759 RepID=A0A7W4IAL3_9PROT|nr:hypothetical protein [Gluconacetobacter sacchari]MBB2159333.1 hypothetical protein [Gluconacetobacter sacchari]GBQ19431.1 hypothetical protein AA12717_0245 [Gluconacetobacter sacchari DSM 12717]
MRCIPLLHTGLVNGQPVRFYQAPHGGASYPWHAHDDLLAAMQFPNDGGWKRITDMPSDAAPLAVWSIDPGAPGPVVICDNRLAREFFSAAPLGAPLVSSGFGEYRDALAEAVGLLTADMRDPEDRATWLTNAWLRDQGEQPMPPIMETELRKMTRATGRTIFDPGSGNGGPPASVRSTIH